MSSRTVLDEARQLPPATNWPCPCRQFVDTYAVSLAFHTLGPHTAEPPRHKSSPPHNYNYNYNNHHIHTNTNTLVSVTNWCWSAALVSAWTQDSTRRDERVPQILIRNNVPASYVSGPPIKMTILYGPCRQTAQPA
jgi:hypothetical protein